VATIPTDLQRWQSFANIFRIVPVMLPVGCPVANSGKDVAKNPKMLQRCGKDAANMLRRCGKDVAKM
jgi:hypothetical protein